jgi:hypothetical protein
LEKELSQNKLKINETICINNKGFSYLYNLSEEIFDFTNIKSNIKNMIQYLNQYSKDKQEYFLKDFDNFTQNKKGTFRYLIMMFILELMLLFVRIEIIINIYIMTVL